MGLEGVSVQYVHTFCVDCCTHARGKTKPHGVKTKPHDLLPAQKATREVARTTTEPHRRGKRQLDAFPRVATIRERKRTRSRAQIEPGETLFCLPDHGLPLPGGSFDRRGTD